MLHAMHFQINWYRYKNFNIVINLWNLWDKKVKIKNKVPVLEL